MFLKEFFENVNFVIKKNCKDLNIIVSGCALVILSLDYIQSNLGYPNADYPKLLGYSKTMDSPEFFLYYLMQ